LFAGIGPGFGSALARSTPGVTTALVAMRSPEHVDENLALASHEPAKPEQIDALFDRARKRAATG